MQGAREGYKAGYDDGYNDRAGRYGQIYGRPTDGASSPTRNGAGAARSTGSADMSFDVGYRDGITAGQADHGRNVRSNFRDTDAYRNADLGYQTTYGDRDAYRAQFRDGFERGYQDGYGRTQYSTDGGGYFATPGGTGAANMRADTRVDTRDGQGTPTRTFTVPGNRQWTSTSIRVNQDDPLRFETTGEVRFTANANDRAGSAGSLDRKYSAGAPLPMVFVGALIGRIDNGRPFGIGNQTSVRMPASGTLYLGVNDDNVGDNAGQFQVVLSW
jgi:hypothetical protein